VPDPTFVGEALRRAGRPETLFFSWRSTHAFASRGPEGWIICFRGTEPEEFEDWKTDLRLLLAPEGAGRAHAGFVAALEGIYAELEARTRDAPVLFGGHSLGGALATLAAARHPRAAAVYTFGAPRAVDSGFARLFRVPAFRYVNNNDLVPFLPPPIAYRHVGRLLYLDRAGNRREGAGVAETLLDLAAGHLDRVREAFAAGFAGVFWDSIVDHSPWHYARLVRRDAGLPEP